MNVPVDLGGLEILLAVAILIVGTIVFCVGLALGARGVDRLWDIAEGSR